MPRWTVVPLVVPLLGLAGTGCVLGPKLVMAHNVAGGEYCASQNVVDPASAAMRRAPDEAGAPTPAAVERGYSSRSLAMARAIGATGHLERLAAAQARGAPEPEIAELREQLNDVISLATLDLSSVVAHIQCEAGRAAQVSGGIRDAERAQTQNLTADAILVGAAAAIAAGVLSIADKTDPVPAGVVGIAGGAVGGGLGFATIAVHRTTLFHHRRNILAEFWYGAAHPDFPETVWAFLTRPEFTKKGTVAIRDAVTRMWRESGRLGDDPAQPSSDTVGLFFGEGGRYDADGLDARAAMLSELRQAVELMNHDLQYFATEAAHR